MGEGARAEGAPADEHATGAAARQDGRRARPAKTRADAVPALTEQLHRRAVAGRLRN